jgi:hypothetical protein
MSALDAVAPAFVEMAHRIVWCSVTTVDPDNRPWTRILHPWWEWDGEQLVGWVATSPTPLKRAHVAHTPYVACSYWAPTHDTCDAECRATWVAPEDLAAVWDRFVDAPEPVGYDPSIVPAWKDGPSSPAFGALRLEPWRLRVFPGTVLLTGTGAPLVWQAARG